MRGEQLMPRVSRTEAMHACVTRMIVQQNEAVKKANEAIDRQSARTLGEVDLEPVGQDLFTDQVKSILIALETLKKNMQKSDKIDIGHKGLYLMKLDIILRVFGSLEEAKGNSNRIMFATLTEAKSAVDETIEVLKKLSKADGGFFCNKDHDIKISLAESMLNLVSKEGFWSKFMVIQPILAKQNKKYYMQYEDPSILLNQLKNFAKSIEESSEKRNSKSKDHRNGPKTSKIPENQSPNNFCQDQTEQHKSKNQISLNQNTSQLKEEIQRLTHFLEINVSLRQAHEELFGIARCQNISQAMKTYSRLSKQITKTNERSEIAAAIENVMGYLHEQGRHFPQSYAKAAKHYLKSAEMNDSEGCYRIGKFLQNGYIDSNLLFPDCNYNRLTEVEKAMEYYEKAAKMGHLQAITDLGHIYDHGMLNEGAMDSTIYRVEPDVDQAFKYYSKALKKYFPRAANNLGALIIRLYNNGQELPRDQSLEKGIQYFEMAAEQGYAKAYLNLAKCYENGKGVPIDLQKAKMHLLVGAKKGDQEAKMEYAKFIMFHHATIDESTQQSQRLFLYLQQITQKHINNADAFYLISLCYEQGIGVNINQQCAYQATLHAAELNHTAAQAKLGDYFISGYFVEKDKAEARRHYQAAASKKHAQAIANLQRMDMSLNMIDEQSDIQAEGNSKTPEERIVEEANLKTEEALRLRNIIGSQSRKGLKMEHSHDKNESGNSQEQKRNITYGTPVPRSKLRKENYGSQRKISPNKGLESLAKSYDEDIPQSQVTLKNESPMTQHTNKYPRKKLFNPFPKR